MGLSVRPAARFIGLGVNRLDFRPLRTGGQGGLVKMDLGERAAARRADSPRSVTSARTALQALSIATGLSSVGACFFSISPQKATGGWKHTQDRVIVGRIGNPCYGEFASAGRLIDFRREANPQRLDRGACNRLTECHSDSGK